MDKESDDLGDIQTLVRHREFFQKATNVIEEIQMIVAERTETACDVLFPLLYAILDANRAVSLLATNGGMRSAYVVARVSLETIVNTCFILTIGDEAAERARQHARQKAFRDLDRKIEINGQKLQITCAAKTDWEKIPEVQAAVAAFTRKNGREVKQWTNENVEERIEVVEKKHGHKAAVGLMFALFAIYRHGSEIAHGSLFGALFSLGLTLPMGKRDGDFLERYIRMNLSTLLWFLGRAMTSLVFVLEKEMGFPGFHEKMQGLEEECRPTNHGAEGVAFKRGHA